MVLLNSNRVRAVLLTLLIVAAPWNAVTADVPAPDGSQRPLEVLGIRMEEWQRPNACGPNCLFVFLRLQGIQVSHQEVVAGVPTSDQGASLADLQAYSAARGVRADVVFATPASLGDLPLPAIAHLGEGVGRSHFVLVSSVTAENVCVVDGGTGEVQTIDRTLFEQRWSGYLLTPARRHWTWQWAGLLALPVLALGLVAGRFLRRKQQ